MKELISSTRRIKDFIAEYKHLTRSTVETVRPFPEQQTPLQQQARNQGKHSLIYRKNFSCSIRMFKHCKMLPGESVESLSLDVFGI